MFPRYDPSIPIVIIRPYSGICCFLKNLCLYLSKLLIIDTRHGQNIVRSEELNTLLQFLNDGLLNDFISFIHVSLRKIFLDEEGDKAV